MSDIVEQNAIEREFPGVFEEVGISLDDNIKSHGDVVNILLEKVTKHYRPEHVFTPYNGPLEAMLPAFKDLIVAENLIAVLSHAKWQKTKDHEDGFNTLKAMHLADFLESGTGGMH